MSSRTSGFFVEIDSFGAREHGQMVSGDVCVHTRKGNRSVVVLSDGAGSGVRANVIAEIIATMAMNYTYADSSPDHTAEAILGTFIPGNDDCGGEATYSILDINRGGSVCISEYDNPPFLLIRNGKVIDIEPEIFRVNETVLKVSRFEAEPEDRIVLVSDGVSGSGKMTRRLPQGWGMDGLARMCMDAIAERANISAHELTRAIVKRASENDLFAPKNDMMCAVAYFRKPRKILVCTGPPFNDHPVSSMKGVDLVTEGVLTLSKVKSLLERTAGTGIEGEGMDSHVARMLLGHDIIEFVVGTRINPVHQDPELPMELELRRNLIKSLAWLLENKFMKDVKVQYI